MQLTLDAFGHNEKISNKFLIIGGGNIGFNLAKNLENSHESARIKIIEKNKQRAEYIANELNNSGYKWQRTRGRCFERSKYR